MKFSKKSVYGLRAIVSLKEGENGKNVSLAQIAKKQGISKKYLEQLFSKLKKAGLVISEKGVNGGYKLSRSPEKITAFEIIKALDENMSPTNCLNDKGEIACFGKKKCGAVFVLAKVQNAVNEVLKKTTLKEIAK